MKNADGSSCCAGKSLVCAPHLDAFLIRLPSIVVHAATMEEHVKVNVHGFNTEPNRRVGFSFRRCGERKLERRRAYQVDETFLLVSSIPSLSRPYIAITTSVRVLSASLGHHVR